MRQLLRFIFYTTLYAISATLLNMHYLADLYQIDTDFFSLIGVILSLFLVFRLNSGYYRWWEGRKAWGALVNDSRSLSLKLDSIIPIEDMNKRRYFGRHISNFCMSLVLHLRDSTDLNKYHLEKSDKADEIAEFKHHPNKFGSKLFRELEAMHKNNNISDFDKYFCNKLVQRFIDTLGTCERIKKTPIPFSHSTFIKLFIVIYIIILPFGLANVFGYLTIPAVMVMAFAMIGIEVISEEIENPFGTDANDLPIGFITDTITENVFEVLGIDHEIGYTAKKYSLAEEAEIIH
ncbi:bestrophin family protein [Endozoicomonas lisbonensis]